MGHSVTLGGTVVWTRNAAGDYEGTLAGAFTVNKTQVIITAGGAYTDTLNQYIDVYAYLSSDPDKIYVVSEYNGELSDGQMSKAPIQIIVYP